MIGQPQSRRRRAMLIAMPAIVSREPQGLLRPMEIVIEELQAHQCIEGGIAEGFGVCLAGEGTEPITQGTIESFDMYVPACSILAPAVARISTESSRPCSSRCLTVCVKLTLSGTTKRGRPRLPVSTRLR